MTDRHRTISRTGVVRAAAQGCVTVEVGVPCDGCRQGACVSRQRSPRLTLAAPELGPGERVRISVGANRLTGVSLALFGPPLIALALAGWLTSGAAAAGTGPMTPSVVAGVVALGLALVLGAWLGRRLTADLAIDVIPTKPVPRGASEV